MKESGEYQFESEFILNQRNKSFKKIVKSNQKVVVNESSVSLDNIRFSFTDADSSRLGLSTIASVTVKRPIWLVLCFSFTYKGEPIKVSRNIELLDKQSADVTFSLPNVNRESLEAGDLILHQVDLIDFDTNSDASLIRRYFPNQIIKHNVQIKKNELNN